MTFMANLTKIFDCLNGNWDTNFNSAYTKDYLGFQSYCSAFVANGGTFNGGQGCCSQHNGRDATSNAHVGRGLCRKNMWKDPVFSAAYAGPSVDLAQMCGRDTNQACTVTGYSARSEDWGRFVNLLEIAQNEIAHIGPDMPKALSAAETISPPLSAMTAG